MREGTLRAENKRTQTLEHNGRVGRKAFLDLVSYATGPISNSILRRTKGCVPPIGESRCIGETLAADTIRIDRHLFRSKLSIKCRSQSNTLDAPNPNQDLQEAHHALRDILRNTLFRSPGFFGCGPGAGGVLVGVAVGPVLAASALFFAASSPSVVGAPMALCPASGVGTAAGLRTVSGNLCAAAGI